MTPRQFDIITSQRFASVKPSTLAACRSVILGGMTAYAAEQEYECARGTVSRYVNKVHAEWAYCQEVTSHE